MEPSGGGGAEVRLYRRPSYAADLEDLAVLELVAPPRRVEVGSDPPVEQVDGEIDRSAGLYIALVQDGRVVDVARLLTYTGEAAGPEDEAEDYWKTGSSTSEDEWHVSPTREARVFEYALSSSSSEEDNHKEGCALASTHGVKGELEDETDGVLSVSGRLWFGQDQYHWSDSSFWRPIREDSSDGGSNKEGGDGGEDAIDGEKEDGDGDLEEEEHDDDDSDGEDEDDGDEVQHQHVKLNMRLWLAKKHVRIKIFSGIKWLATKVYCLTWINHEALEELFESSFKMDVGAPVAANTVFRIRDSLMDFEVHMLHAPNFDELVSEFKPSVEDFKFCQKIGGENDCRVFKCLYEGSKFALKTVRLENFCIMEPREVEVISSLNDKHVMKFYQSWVEPWIYKNKPIEDYLFIQLELCQSTLKDLLLPESFGSIVDRWYLSEEIVKGVKTIHNESIVHRDLKPDNIFFDSDMGVRIGDFGDSCIGQDELGGYGGTPGLGTEFYSAPELEFAEKITQKADIYSVGVMFVEIFTRFRTVRQRYEVLEELRKEGLPDDCLDLVGDREGARELVKRMTTVEPAYRPSAAEVLEYIQH